MLSAPIPFTDTRKSVDFHQVAMNYTGKSTDPATGISGYVHEAGIDAPDNDNRYFLFSDQNLNVPDPGSNGIRGVVYYNGKGDRVDSTTARVYFP